MAPTHEFIAVADAERVVDALNEAAGHASCPIRLHRFLLTSVQQLLDRPSHCHLMLLDQLDRTPAPRVLHRFMVSSDIAPLMPDTDLQRVVDEVAPHIRAALPGSISELDRPCTVIASEDLDRDWFEQTWKADYLIPNDFEDSLFAIWRPDADREVVITLHRRAEEPAFTEIDRSRASLMIRGAAPLVDWEMFKESDVIEELPLTERQREVLLELLKGKSEKEIASRLHRSTHTIHTHVKQLYERFDVSSRGQLMARFIDKAVLEGIQSN